MSLYFQQEIEFLGIKSSPAFVRAPEGNGYFERAIRMVKEQLLWVKTFDTSSNCGVHCWTGRNYTTSDGSSNATVTFRRARGGVSTRRARRNKLLKETNYCNRVSSKTLTATSARFTDASLCLKMF
jgi:hypothetical protein